MTARVGQSLNQALHELFGRRDRVWLLGEDIADPYGGAFKITKGLSTAYPDRVLTTPLSENAIVGVAGGLALCGDIVIVEIMFGDFVGLAFDQILNFLSKSVTMYGARTPMRVIVRCPVGGGRGYGATHSQSLQKHFVGVPNLALYELTPFHDPGEVLAAAIAGEVPCLLFEDKVLYTRRMFQAGEVDDRFRFELVGPQRNWARVYAPGAYGAPTLVIATGGVVHRCLEAARAALDLGRNVELLVPARLYPFAVAEIVDRLADVDGVVVVEESTSGGTWGAEVATRLYAAAWPLLRRPIELVNSADSIIASAPHLERELLVSSGSILDRLLGAAQAPARATPPGSVDMAESSVGPHLVTVPKLNNNDATYVLVEWLAGDGELVVSGQPLASIETSKAVEELAADRAGLLRISVLPGSECAPGMVIAQLAPVGPAAVIGGGPQVPAAPATPLAATRSPTVDGSSPSIRSGVGVQAPLQRTAMRDLPAGQRRVVAAVTASHRDIPAAFTVVRVDVEGAVVTARRVGEETGAAVGVTELVIQTVARLHQRFPQIFAHMVAEGIGDDHHLGLSVVGAAEPVIGVTVDVGTGLFLPVIRGAAEASLGDIADALVELRMKALRSRLRESDLIGMNLLVALNNSAGVVVAQPIIPPGVTCALSIPDLQRIAVVDADGQVRARLVADIGLAYDHRMVNGALAGEFLTAVRDALQVGDPK